MSNGKTAYSLSGGHEQFEGEEKESKNYIQRNHESILCDYVRTEFTKQRGCKVPCIRVALIYFPNEHIHHVDSSRLTRYTISNETSDMKRDGELLCRKVAEVSNMIAYLGCVRNFTASAKNI